VSGPAIIRDRRHGLTYIASMAHCGERSVTFRGRLQHTDVRGSRLYPARTRTLPLSTVEIEWPDDQEQEAA
jgi:hypothetical protein